MSRIGRKPISLPKGVEIKVEDGNFVTVKGPKGTLQPAAPPAMIIEQDNGTLNVSRPSDEKQHQALHGLTRTLVDNMVVGVTDA